jgi:hypothetical protein
MLFSAAVLAAIAFGLYIASSADHLSPTGEVSQSPYVYVIFTLLIFTMGFLLTKVLAGENSKFSFAAFLNVAFAGLLVSGIAHELVHVLLISHPVQLRVHFGDSKAIFSTCCLSPGEAPFEGIAYAIQFMILILWVFFSRHTFYSGRFRELWKNKFLLENSTHSLKSNAVKKKASKKEPEEFDEEDLEREWKQHKELMEAHLIRKTTPKQRGKEDDLEDDVRNLGKLKV